MTVACSLRASADDAKSSSISSPGSGEFTAALTARMNYRWREVYGTDVDAEGSSSSLEILTILSGEGNL